MTYLSEYQSYVVNEKLPNTSKDSFEFINAIVTISERDYVLVPQLVCGAIGQSSESAELLKEVLKTESDHIIDELGDVYYYLNVSATALDIKLFEYTSRNYVDVSYTITLTKLQVVQQISVNAGMYLDVVKKLLFQGKPYTPMIEASLMDLLLNIYHYINHLCFIMGITLEDVINANRNKLDARYKKQFTVTDSENKK
jgi:NTP pyrophosphatase (non-canonical NTP hydrolase)